MSKEIPDRSVMNRKPVFFSPQGKILNLESGFKHKHLCDGPTFSMGLACAYSCSFCYVDAQLFRHPTVVSAKKEGFDFNQVVIRRLKALETLESQLVDSKGKPRFADPNDNRVIYSSPLVDVAANMDLVRETIEACKLILKHTHWQIRLLSKSNLLPMVANGIPLEYKNRMIFGVSTGTADDKIAQAFESGTPLVSKRIASIRDLQDDGWRTFGMICPSLPQDVIGDPTPEVVAKTYEEFSRSIVDALRVDRMEHVWAEVINVRGESMERTYKALSDAGFVRLAKQLAFVSNSNDAWEKYARATFEAHVKVLPPGKLKFLQYVNDNNVDWWKTRVSDGAVLLGKIVYPDFS